MRFYYHIITLLLFLAAPLPFLNAQISSSNDSLTFEKEEIGADSIYKEQGTVPYRLNLDYIKSFWPSLKYTVSRPAHWDKKDITRLSLFAAGAGTLLLSDWEIRNAMLHNRNKFNEKVAGAVEPFGNTYGVYIFPAMYLAGVAFKSPKLESTGLVGAKSLAISTIIYTASKKLIRRNRPDAATSSWDYAPPFTKAGYTSSPSGHSNTIFTVATVLALEFRETKWVPPLVYSIATATAVSRLYHNRHWSSDIFLGSLMGHYVTKAVWNASQPKYKRKNKSLTGLRRSFNRHS